MTTTSDGNMHIELRLNRQCHEYDSWNSVL